MKNTSYVSEATQFINTLLKKSGTREQQLKLRHTWWDTGFPNQDEVKEYAAATVQAKAYAYFTYSNHSADK